MLSAKQDGIKNHFLSLWHDSTWDWTTVSRTIGEHYSLGQKLPFKFTSAQGQKCEAHTFEIESQFTVSLAS